MTDIEFRNWHDNTTIANVRGTVPQIGARVNVSVDKHTQLCSVVVADVRWVYTQDPNDFQWSESVVVELK